jgi:diguanylate cyclase
MNPIHESISVVLLGMMGAPIWCGLVLSAFAVGWVGCRWSRIGKSESDATSRSALKLLRDVFLKTENISRDLIEYRELLAGLAHRVNSADDTESSAQLLSQSMKLNLHLQERLEESERALREQTEQLAIYISEARVDAHSGLNNRRSFDEELERQFAYWRRSRHRFSLVMIDVDHFKSINDRYGHQAGDFVIRAIGTSLKQTLRTSDFIARYGGEEFAAVLRGSDLDMAHRAAQRCCEAIRNCSVIYHGTTIPVTASCGVATAIEEEDSQKLLARADEALYQAKALGRNTVVIHDGMTFQRGLVIENVGACHV